eukprot:COSAG06_NODE_65299_length_257_cov_0.683544_1_plen_85_part_11
MFADVRQGGCPSYPAPGGGAPGPDDVQEGVPRQPAGPLPRRPDGAYFIDRNGASFRYARARVPAGWTGGGGGAIGSHLVRRHVAA